MGQAIDVGDAASQLQQARAEADSAAKDVGIGSLDVTRQPAGPDRVPLPRRGRAAPLVDPTAAQADATQQPSDAESIPHGDLQPTPPPPPAPEIAKAKPGTWDQSGSEIGNGVMRGFAQLGRAAAMVMSVPAIVGDAADGDTKMQDAWFQAIDKYANQAVDYWKPQDPNKSGLGAQVLGDVASIAPSLTLGPAAPAALAAQATTDAGVDSVQAGQDAKTAGILAAVAGISNVLGMKIPLKSPSIIKRIASSILGNTVINTATQTLTKEILNSNGYKEAASKIDLTDPHSVLSMLATSILFALHRQSGAKPAEADKNASNGVPPGGAPPPDEDAAAAPPGPAGDDGAQPPPPPTVAGATPPPTAGMPGATPGAQPVEGSANSSVPPASKVSDTPSIEPAKDLRAQLRDMNDPKTPRVGVLLAHDSKESLKGSKDANAMSVMGQLGQAVAQDRTVDTPQGILILKTKKIADVTKDRISKGEDLQSVIGSVTGSGSGKTPDMTAVVQGKDDQGNVTSETAVHPDNVDQAVRDVTAQGKTPNVTTPEAAVQNRINAVSTERNTPTVMGIMKRPDGTEMAVHVEPGAPDGMVRVRQLDADGEPTKTVVDVAKNRVKIGAPADTNAATKVPPASEAGPESTPRPAVEGTQPVKPATEAGPNAASPKSESAPSETGPVVSAKPEDTAPSQSDRRIKDDLSVDERRRLGDEPQDMTMTKEQRAARRAEVAANRARAEGLSGDLEPEPIPKNAATVEGEAARRDAMSEEERDAYDKANRLPSTGETREQIQARLDAEAEQRGADTRTREEASGQTPSERLGMTPEERSAHVQRSRFEGQLQKIYGDDFSNEEIRADNKDRSPEEKARIEDWLSRRKEPAKPALKAKPIETGLQALPAALEAHEQQEQIPTGKKFAAPLAERQENASTFAAILKAAADSARGKASPSAIERATKAAKAAERLAEKGKEETAAGQGTGHVKITALVNEMHKAARGLLGTTREGDEVVVKPKEAELLAKKERDAARVRKAAGLADGEKPPARIRVRKKVDTNETVVVDEKPVAKTRTEIEREGNRLTDQFIHAEEEDLPAARRAVEAYLKEHYPDQYTPDQTRDILNLLMERRLEENPDAEQTGPRRMSETIEPEDIAQPTDAKTLKTLGLRNAGKHALQFASNKLQVIKNVIFNNRMQTQYHNLAAAMLKSGELGNLVKGMDSGKAFSTHALLDQMLAHAEGELKPLLENLRAHVPDLPVHVVSAIQDLRVGRPFGNKASGLFDPKYNSIQVSPNRKVPSMTIRTIVHEMIHGATSYEIQRNPTGALNTALENARQILIQRLARIYGKEVLYDHMKYFRGEGDRPENYNRNLYGITNTEEMLAELHVNHDFVQEIVDSERVADPSEQLFGGGILGGAKTLLHKIYGAIGRFMGLQEPKLLQHIAGLAERTMDMQSFHTREGGELEHLGGTTAKEFENVMVQNLQNRFKANPFEINRALPSFEEVARDPPPLRGVEPEMRASFGDDETAAEPTRVARLFKQAMNSGVIDGVRAIKTALKTVPQIYRDHRRDFGGRNDPSNPLVRLQDIDRQKASLMREMGEHSRDVVRRWMRVSDEDNKTIGTVVRDWTMNRVDPRKPFEEQSKETQAAGKARYDEFANQWDRLQKTQPENARIVSDIFDVNRKLALAERRANIDTAAEAFAHTPLSDAQRTLLYGARTPEAFEDLVGDGKLIDVGENNDKFKEALKDFAGRTELNGPYAHLGRHGEYVVTAKPEGTKKFRTEQEARAFEKQVNDLSPNSRGNYVLRGGEHQVDYKVQYTSFHETRNEALAERERLKGLGYDTGLVTRKTMSREDTPLSAGARDLTAAVEARIKRANGNQDDQNVLLAALRSAMLHLAASRSAYAGSRLARKNFAGVKPEEMRRSFADHTQSTIWHTAQLRVTFKQADALSTLRNMARDDSNVSQDTLFRRGQAVEALNKHMQDEVQNFGHKSPTNAAIARLGFMNYLASPSHAFIWMTQNFTTGIPVAGARWGYGRASTTFMHAMGSVLSPAMRDAVNESFRKGGATKDANEAMMRVLSNHDRWGKWAPQIRQMINDGVLGHGYGNELHEMSQANDTVLGVSAQHVNRAFDVARLMPAMADAFNRVSSALTALELTGGDVRKAADFVDEVHADYSAGAKPLAFKKIGRIPGMNSLTMFRTYTQSMIHLFYGNVKAALDGSGEGGKLEAAKTVAGMVVANALFAGVYGAAAIEPLKLAVYAYHKLFDKEGEVYDLKNSIHNWLVEHMGKTAGNAAAGGLPHIAGFDLSSRMGLSDLFLHDPPDMFTADKSNWDKLAGTLGGPMYDYLASNVTNFVGHMQRGEGFQAVSSLVPVKAYQDAVKAYQLGTVGKTNSIGGRMTKPSGMDAAYQAFGLKPSSVADAQEVSNTKINYQTQVKATKESILKSYASASTGDERLRAQARINEFNRQHPSEAIKVNEIRSMMKYRQETQNNQPGKNQTLNNMLKYAR